MNITSETRIGELVAQDYRTALVFKKHKIDFCCQGGRTIKEACEKKNVLENEVLQELENIYTAVAPLNNFQEFQLDELADYIEENHHLYVAQAIPVINQYLDKVCKVHGAHHPELIQIHELFTESGEELSHHMMKEELVLFPFVKRMAQAQRDNEKLELPGYGSVENPIAMMKHEHNTEGERFRKIAELSNDYQPPAEACNTYRVVFALLKEFEEDLHKHIHLENNILFPKAMELEKAF